MMERLPNQIVLCGKGKIAVRALQFTVAKLASLGIQIPIAVSSTQDDAGEDTWYPSLIKAARSMGIQIFPDIYHFSDNPDLLLISLEFDKIIKVDRFVSKRLFNIHFSKLPKYRGVYTSILPILNGDEESGVTLHYIDSGIDTGDIVAQRSFALSDHITARQLYDLYMEEAQELYMSQFEYLLMRQVMSRRQDLSMGSFYNRKSLNFAEKTVLSLMMSSHEIRRHVRAFYFPEYQVATFKGMPVKAAFILGDSIHQPGHVLLETKLNGVYVAGDRKAIELVWA